jgi:hypothetical protein
MIYHRVDEFADELQDEININDGGTMFTMEDKKESFNGYSFPSPLARVNTKIGQGYSPETIKILQQIQNDIKRIALLMKHVDYLYEGDSGEETFKGYIKTIDPTLIKE